MCAGRRGGKTVGVDVADLEDASTLGWSTLYVTMTRANAKEIAWDDLVRLNDEYSLGGRVQLGDLSIRWRNGGLVALRGANNEREIAKIRGKKWHRVVIDECQSIPDRVLVPLLGPILAPTLLDHGGELWLTGSRPAVRAGHWFEVTEGKLRGNYEQHRYDIRDNTMLPARLAGRDIDDILAEFRREQGWTESDITYRREVLNEDIEDTESLLYQFSDAVNLYDTLPTGGNWSYVFGIDMGYDDSDAIAVWGWTDVSPCLYLVDEYVQSKQDVTDLAEAAKALQGRYQPIAMAIDEGGGKKAAAEIRRRHGIPVEAADKAQKGAHIRLLNTDLRKGLIKAREGSRFREDCRLVQRDIEALARGVFQERPRSKGGYHSDITDAALYGWRKATNFRYQPPVPPPLPEPDLLERARLDKILAAANREREWFE